MFEALAEAIEDLEVPAEGTAIVEALALRDRLDAKICKAVGDFDAAGLWDLDAATSATAWLRHHAAMTRQEAALAAMRAKRLRRLPVTAAAWRGGDLSSGQLDAVLAGLGPRHLELFSVHEAVVVPAVVGLSVADTAKAMARWRARADAELDEAEPTEPERALHLSRSFEGSFALDGTLDPAGGQVVATAIRVAGTDEVEAEPARRPAERRADALVDICRFFLDHQCHRPGGRHRPHLNVVVEVEDLEAGRGGGGRRRGGGAGHPGPVVRLGPAPGGDGGSLGGDRLRHLHPHHPHPLVERLGGKRRALSLPGL
jgi:hypothetical protein